MMQRPIRIAGAGMGALMLTLALSMAGHAMGQQSSSPKPTAAQSALPEEPTQPPVLEAYAVSPGPVASSASSSAQQADEQAACEAGSDDLLNVLQANGTLTKEQYDALKARNAERCKVKVAQSIANAAASSEAPRPCPAGAAAAGPGQPCIPSSVVRSMDSGIGLHMGDYTLSVAGEVNTYYIHDRPDRSVASNCLLCLATVGGDPTSQIGDGMLPGWIDVLLSTHKDGWDTSVGFGIWPSINSLIQSSLGVNYAGGSSVALSNTGVDFRQEYITVGRPKLGTFKLGRDIGFFGAEAALNDMALFGAGTVSGTGSPSSSVTSPGPGATTVGRFGTGDIYTDFIPQISYATPVFEGLSAQIGIFQPMSDAVSTSLTNGVSAFSAPYTANGSPMFQMKVAYSSPDKKPVTAKLWFNYLTQKMEADASDVSDDPLLTVGESKQAWALDYGTKIVGKWANFVGYGYDGKGIGNEGIFLLATDPSGARRTSHGYYLQLMTTPGKWTFGVSYGMSALLPASSEVLTSSTEDIVRNNLSWIVQGRYALTNWFSGIAEYNHERSESQVGGITTSDSVALGGIAWF